MVLKQLDKRAVVALALLCHLFFSVETAKADTAIRLSKGQTVYVPIYSHIYSGNREQPFYLAATLSIRNADPGLPNDHLITRPRAAGHGAYSSPDRGADWLYKGSVKWTEPPNEIKSAMVRGG